MIRHLLLALALAPGVSGAAQAQAQVTTVASCSNTGVSNAVGALGRFYAGPDGVLCTSGSGGGGGGTANPYPGSDYATSARQDAQTAALGAPADAAYTGSGNAGNVALGKGQYAILSNLLAGIGATGDTASTATGANGSQVALLKALRDKLNGTLAVSGTVTANIGTTNGLALDATAATGNTNTGAISAAAGTTADAATASGANTTIIGALRAIRDRLLSTLSVSNSGTFPVQNTAAVVGGNSAAVKTDGSAVTQPVSAANLPLPAGAATSANQSTEIAALGAPADTAYAGSGSSSIVAALKGIYAALVGPTPAGGNVIGSTTIRGGGGARSIQLTTTNQSLIAANGARQGWKVKNDCNVDVWINFDAAASAVPGGGNFKIAANGGYLASEPGFVETGTMWAITSSGTCNITAREH